MKCLTTTFILYSNNVHKILMLILACDSPFQYVAYFIKTIFELTASLVHHKCITSSENYNALQNDSGQKVK